MQTLDQVPVGLPVKVVDIQAGWGLRRRLSQMGIHPGDKLIVTRSGALGGPVIVSCHGVEIALGRGLARKIIVTEP